MSVQPLLPFADVPVTCRTQARYYTIAPCLAGKIEPRQQAVLLNLSYSTVSQWLKKFRNDVAEEVSDSQMVSRARIFAQGLQHRTRTDDDQEDYETEPAASSCSGSRKAGCRERTERTAAARQRAVYLRFY